MFFLLALKIQRVFNIASALASPFLFLSPPSSSSSSLELGYFWVFVYMLSRLLRLTTSGSSSSPHASLNRAAFVTSAQTNKGGDACFFKKCVALTIWAGLQFSGGCLTCNELSKGVKKKMLHAFLESHAALTWRQSFQRGKKRIISDAFTEK